VLLRTTLNRICHEDAEAKEANNSLKRAGNIVIALPLEIGWLVALWRFQKTPV